MRPPLPPLALAALLSASCGADPPTALAPPGPTASASAPPARKARRARPPRPTAPEKAPCDRAAELRSRVDGLLSEGKLFHTRRALALANELCPATARETWTLQVSTLLELGALEEARALAETITRAADAPAEARKAAEVALAEVSRLSRAPGKAAGEAAKKPYAQAAEAFLKRDVRTARRAAERAWVTYRPNPDALILAGQAARAEGDVAAAQRLFDRARVEVALKDDSARGRVDGPWRSGVELLTRDPRSGDDALLYSPASGRLVVGILDLGTQILDTDGRTRSLLDQATGGVVYSTFAFMALSPDGRRLVRQPRLRSTPSAAEIYDVETGLLVRQLPGAAGGGMAPLCLSPDGKRVAGVVGGRELWVLDVESGRRVWSTKLSTWPSWIGYTGDGKHIATLHRWDGPWEVGLHDAATGRKRPLPGGEEVAPTTFSLAASPDGNHLAGFFARRLRLLDVHTGKLGVSFDVTHEHEKDILPLGYSPDSRRVLVVRSLDVVIADTTTGKVTATFVPPAPDRPNEAVFLDDRSILIKGGGDVFWEWEIGATAPRRTLGPSVARHSRAAFSPVDDRIATALADGDVALWDPGSPSTVQRLSGHTGPVTSVAFSEDGGTLVSASRDGTARRWEVPSGRLLGVLSGHTGPLTALAIAPDGRRVATGSEDGTARLWDLDTATELVKLPHPGRVGTVAFSADGKQLLTGAGDGVLRLYDCESGSQRQSAPTSLPVRMAFWTGGGEVVSSSGKGDDAHFFRWVPDSGAVEEKKDLPTYFSTAAHTDDGQVIAVADSFGDAKILDLVSEKVVDEVAVDGATVAGLALRDDVELYALATTHGLSLFHRGSKKPAITLSVTPGFSAVMAQTDDGYFDITGPDGDALRRLSRCVVGSSYLPLELCEEQFRVPGLFAKVMAGDASFRDP